MLSLISTQLVLDTSCIVYLNNSESLQYCDSEHKFGINIAKLLSKYLYNNPV